MICTQVRRGIRNGRFARVFIGSAAFTPPVQGHLWPFITINTAINGLLLAA